MARTVTPPRPDLIRRPTERFGWLEDRLLREGWLQRLGPEAVCILVLLALAADRNGCSFYGRKRMAEALGMPRPDVDAALARLLQMRLVAHRPWRTGDPDGIWQLLPLPSASRDPRRQPPPSTPRTRCTSAQAEDAESNPVVVGEALRDLISSLAAAHGFPVSQQHDPHSAPSAE